MANRIPIPWEVESISPNRNPLGSPLKISMKKRVIEYRKTKSQKIWPSNVFLFDIQLKNKKMANPLAAS